MEYKVSDVVSVIESVAPLSYQESYDNSGLLIGQYNNSVNGALICLDVTEEVVDEAISLGVNMIVSHHPVVFSGIKRFNNSNYTERIVIKAIKNDINIYAAHTNLDSVKGGINSVLADIIGLKSQQVLQPVNNDLYKLVVFIPEKHLENVSSKIFEAGAGNIGNYDCCGFSADGQGTFRGNEDANPFVGSVGELHKEKEVRFETIFPKHKKSSVVKAMLKAHPYEEVAYDIYALTQENSSVGLGIVGNIEKPMSEIDFLKNLKSRLGLDVIKHTKLFDKPIERVAVCGGSGSFLLNNAIRSKADIFISGDFKYHQFFDAEESIIIADIGHYESEKHAKSIFYELLTKKMTKFATYLSEVNTNPINYI
ncbi:MAG: Nif3-like dinuclear metal center hexameric protein [Bacteroidales bacterium]|jgi:dinuclear metal center YbgI/SA1388 family protein|nr:Nif3-like dinuclear metal center hexameric protein [Bacteroidales bacterium]